MKWRNQNRSLIEYQLGSRDRLIEPDRTGCPRDAAAARSGAPAAKSPRTGQECWPPRNLRRRGRRRIRGTVQAPPPTLEAEQVPLALPCPSMNRTYPELGRPEGRPVPLRRLCRAGSSHSNFKPCSGSWNLRPTRRRRRTTFARCPSTRTCTRREWNPATWSEAGSICRGPRAEVSLRQGVRGRSFLASV